MKKNVCAAFLGGACELPYTLGFVLKNFVFFIPCAVASGLLYLQLLRKLRSGRQSDSKARLSRALSVLWLSWVLLSVPFILFEITMLSELNYDGKVSYEGSFTIMNRNWYDYSFTLYWSPRMVEHQIHPFKEVSNEAFITSVV